MISVLCLCFLWRLVVGLLVEAECRAVLLFVVECIVWCCCLSFFVVLYSVSMCFWIVVVIEGRF